MSQFSVSFDDVSLVYTPIEQGIYDFQIVKSISGTTKKDNTPKLEIVFKVVGPPDSSQIGKQLTMHLSTKMSSTIGQLLAACGMYPLPKELTLDQISATIFQKVVRGRVEHEAYTAQDGKQRVGARLKEIILPQEILDAEKAKA
jgi:hypothetical protein